MRLQWRQFFGFRVVQLLDRLCYSVQRLSRAARLCTILLLTDASGFTFTFIDCLTWQRDRCTRIRTQEMGTFHATMS